MSRRDTFLTGTDLTENDQLRRAEHPVSSGSLALVALSGNSLGANERPSYGEMLHSLEDDVDEMAQLKRMVYSTRKKLDDHKVQRH